MTEKLYTASEIADAVEVTASWIHGQLARGLGVPPDFVVDINRPRKLWREESITAWRTFKPGTDGPVTPYSDHRAVNHTTHTTITWKLWWHNTADGPVWWFSTPDGWWTSRDDGNTWQRTGLMERLGHHHYYSVSGVNGNVRPSNTISSVVRSALALKRHLEGGWG